MLNGMAVCLMKRFKTRVSPWAVLCRAVSPFLLSTYFSEIMGNNNCLVLIKRVDKRHLRKVGTIPSRMKKTAQWSRQSAGEVLHLIGNKIKTHTRGLAYSHGHLVSEPLRVSEWQASDAV